MNTMSNKLHRPFWLLSFSIILVFVFSVKNISAQPNGEKLFKANCASCHYPTDAKLIGPGLKGAQERWPDNAKLYAWIRNAPEFLKTGDPYATALYEQYNKTLMTPFPDLKDEEIAAILDYIENPPEKVASKEDTSEQLGKEPTGSNTTLFVLMGLLALFLILIVVLGGIKKSLQKVVNEKQGLPEKPELGFLESIKVWISSHKKLTALAIILLMSWGTKKGWDALMGIGVYQGYAPEQPIPFSHKIHAGDNAINCVYCHSGAEKSRNAGIPSANVCMNCHKGIQEGTTTGKEEIQKIYTALDYDPATGTYGDNPKPIKWVKVHNLPDHSYFNHSQHVVVGGIECQKCHGPVQEMDVVEQHAELTMGWCVNCHRETEVKMAGSGYYEEIHHRLTDHLRAKYMKDGKITVDELGGIECAKCHY